MNKKERIAAAVKELGLENEICFSVKQLEEIAKRAGCTNLDVMRYLRFGR